jgi:hypothetical protein
VPPCSMMVTMSSPGLSEAAPLLARLGAIEGGADLS